MVLMYEVKTYEEFINLIDELQCEGVESAHPVYVFFTASINSENDQQSWSQVCDDAWEVIRNCVDLLNPQAAFIKVEVGSQKEWESTSNPFKRNKKCKLKVLPTLLHWRSYQKLEGAYCAKTDIVELLFDESESADYDDESM